MKKIKSNPDVTIIVTVHNAENYIEQCIQSAMHQTYENIEIICVDGGSSDSTPDILKSLQSIDDRIIIVNDKNTSYGHKVNVGVEKARGQYVCILESDDSIEKDMVKTLYEITKEKNVDVISGDYKIQFEYRGRKIGYIQHKYPSGLYDRVCDLRSEKRFFLHGGITGVLYKKSFLQNNRIKLNETPGAAFQDQSFSFLVDLLAMTQYHIKTPVYNYTYDNPGSSMADDKKIMEISWECNYIEQQMNSREIEEQYIWENYYNHTSMINEYELTLFVREDEEEALYRKYQESHFQKAYTLREIRTLIEKAGLKFVAAYDAYTKKAPMHTSERITVIAREHGK